MPANGETVSIETTANIPIDVSLSLLKRKSDSTPESALDPKQPRIMHGALIMADNVCTSRFNVLDLYDIISILNLYPSEAQAGGPQSGHARTGINRASDQVNSVINKCTV